MGFDTLTILFCNVITCRFCYFRFRPFGERFAGHYDVRYGKNKVSSLFIEEMSDHDRTPDSMRIASDARRATWADDDFLVHGLLHFALQSSICLLCPFVCHLLRRHALRVHLPAPVDGFLSSQD